jgi:hypothetical protein
LDTNGFQVDKDGAATRDFAYVTAYLSKMNEFHRRKCAKPSCIDCERRLPRVFAVVGVPDKEGSGRKLDTVFVDKLYLFRLSMQCKGATKAGSPQGQLDASQDLTEAEGLIKELDITGVYANGLPR